MKIISRNLLLILMLFVASVTKAQVVFTQAFNTEACLEGFTVIDANNDGNRWTYDSNFGMATCSYNDFGSANDWLISPTIALEAGKTYTVKYMASAYNNNGEKLGIMLGQGNTVAAMTTTILPDAEYELPYNSGVPVKAEFSVAASGNYNIGLHMTSASLMFGGKLFLRSITVSEGSGDYQPVIPAACQLTLNITNENAPYAVNAKVKTPAVDTDGNALEGLKKVELLRDGVVIFSVENPYTNSNVRTDDENIPQGTHTYTAYAYSLDGSRSAPATAVVSLGVTAPDGVPQSVTNLVAAYDPESHKATVTWTAVTKDKDDKDLNDAVTYNIRRKGSYDLIATGLTSTTFVEEVVLDDQVLSAYYVTAENEAGKSSETKSNDVFIGKPYDLPFAESAPQGEFTNAWQITRQGASRWGASDLGSIAYDNDRGYITFCPLKEYDQSTLTSGYINVEGAQNPSFRFHYFYVMPGDDHFDVYVKVDNGEPEKVWNFDYEADDNVAEWMEVTLPLKDIVGEGKNIQLMFDVQMGMPQQPIIYIDDITVIDRRENDLQISVVKAPRNLKPGESRSAIVRVDNLGENDFNAGTYKILAMVGDKCLSTTDGPKMKAGARKDININDIRLDVFNTDTTADLCFVLDVEDEDASNNTTEVIATEVKTVYVSSPANLTAEDGSKAVLNWQSTDFSATVEPLSMTESFEDAPSFTIDDFGEWAVYDGLGTSVYGLSTPEGDVSFPNTCAPQAWTVIDWGTGLFYDSFAPNTGNKMMVAFSHAGTTADSWLISPELSGEEQTITLAAKAATSTYPEKFDILYSTNANRALSTFEVLDESATTVNTTWKTYSFELPEGTRYFVIHCISRDALALLVDDVTFIPEATGTPCREVKGYNVYRNGEKVNASLVTGLTYTDSESVVGNTYNVTAVYATDAESRPSADAVVVPAGINDVDENEYENENRYNLAGQRVSDSYRGVVITKGKKVRK